MGDCGIGDGAPFRLHERVPRGRSRKGRAEAATQQLRAGLRAFGGTGLAALVGHVRPRVDELWHVTRASSRGAFGERRQAKEASTP